MVEAVRQFADWVANNEALVGWLAASSLLIFVGSLLLIPWLIVRIPADYFVRDKSRRSMLRGYNPLLISVLRVLRNLLASIFVAVGVVLLILPGQGLLTIFLGVVVADFPGKHRLVNWLVAQPGICRPLNWLRHRAGKEPIQSPPRGH